MDPRISLAVTVLCALMLNACTSGNSNNTGSNVAGTAAVNGTPDLPVDSQSLPTATSALVHDPTSDPAMSPQDEVVKLVTAAHAKELGVPADQVMLVSAQPKEWPNSGLGCPKPGENYMQMITPGFEILLASGGQQATYHTSDGTTGEIHWVRCDTVP